MHIIIDTTSRMTVRRVFYFPIILLDHLILFLLLYHDVSKIKLCLKGYLNVVV